MFAGLKFRVGLSPSLRFREAVKMCMEHSASSKGDVTICDHYGKPVAMLSPGGWVGYLSAEAEQVGRDIQKTARRRAAVPVVVISNHGSSLTQSLTSSHAA